MSKPLQTAGDTEPVAAPSPAQLTDPEVEVLVERYEREMTRYEEAARLVEDRLRHAMRREELKTLTTARAKHPDEVRRKLRKNRNQGEYRFSKLNAAIDRVVTDLAGCRVMTYRAADVECVARLVQRMFTLLESPKAIEHHNKDSGYRATHILIQLVQDEERIGIRNAVCEVQITSLAAHIHSELEHDITYKDHGCPVTDQDEAALDGLLHAVRTVDPAVEHLLSTRAESVRRQTRAIEDGVQLRFALERLLPRPLKGDFEPLFRLLNAVVSPLTASSLEQLGAFPAIAGRGEQQSKQLGLERDDDDAVNITLGLFDDFRDEFVDLVGDWQGRPGPVKRAILRASEMTGGST